MIAPTAFGGFGTRVATEPDERPPAVSRGPLSMGPASGPVGAGLWVDDDRADDGLGSGLVEIRVRRVPARRCGGVGRAGVGAPDGGAGLTRPAVAEVDLDVVQRRI